MVLGISREFEILKHHLVKGEWLIQHVTWLKKYYDSVGIIASKQVKLQYYMGNLPYIRIV